MSNASPVDTDTRGPVASGWAWAVFWLQPTRLRTLLALTDQMLVSGTSFVLSVAVGRFCGTEGLGIYSLGFSVVVFVVGVQTALISTPYTVFLTRRGDEDDPRVQAGNSLLAAVLLTGLITGFAIVIMLIMVLFEPQHFSPFLPMACALSAAIPWFMLREFARRYDFAQMNMIGAMAVDVSVMALTLGGIWWLVSVDRLSPQAVFAVSGASCAGTFLFWATKRLRNFRLSVRTLRGEFRRDWRFGRWVLADQVICVAHLYILHWLLTGFISPTATGLLAACASLAALSSPFLQGMGNFLSPHFARCVIHGGRAQTLSLFWKSTAFLVTVMLGFAIATAVFGEQLLLLLYKDPSYAGYGHLVGLLALRAVFVAAVLTAHHAVIAMEKPRASAWSSTAGLCTTFGAALVLIPPFGIHGAVFAALTGALIECVTMCLLFVLTFRNWNWSSLGP